MNKTFALENNIWITEDGECIPIENMETPHIKACIHKIYKSNGTWNNKYLRLFEDELRKRKFQNKF